MNPSQIIREHLSASYPEVAWYEMKGMRNIVAHEYFRVDLKIVWKTARIKRGDETLIQFYQTKIFPYLMNKNIGKPEIMDYRRRLLEKASGNILEIGIGTGLNLNLYPGRITEITAIDPFVRELPSSQMSVKLYPDVAEKMRFEDSSFDTVLSTFSFCSVSNLDITLQEIARVLKPDGKLLFLEHGKADTRFAQKLQHAANPFFNIFACGCNINRDYRQILSEAGFRIEKYTLYKAKIYPKILAGYLYEGVAKNDKH